MMSIFFFALISVFGCTSEDPVQHEFHLSKCDINYSQEDKALQISLRIFIDDLEEAIAKVKNQENLKLCTTKEVANADSILVDYLSDNLTINIDDQIYDLAYVGKEVSEDLLAVWCYFEITDVSPKEIIQIENKILIETFSDQSNVVALKYSNDKKEHFLMKKGETSGTLQLN